MPAGRPVIGRGSFKRRHPHSQIVSWWVADLEETHARGEAVGVFALEAGVLPQFCYANFCENDLAHRFECQLASAIQERPSIDRVCGESVPVQHSSETAVKDLS